MPVALERKSLFARKDLVEKLAEVASKRGVSLYMLVNEVFEQYIKAWELGVSFDYSTAKSVEVLSRVRKANFIVFPEPILAEALGSVPEASLASVLEVSKNFGKWLAKYYEVTGRGNSLENFLEDLRNVGLFPGELAFNEKEGFVVVRVANPKMHVAYARVVASLLAGFLNAAGYRVSGIEVSNGLVVLHAERGEGGE